MQMQEMQNQLRKRLPRDQWDALFVTLRALDKKPEDVQLREEPQSSGAILWVAE